MKIRLNECAISNKKKNIYELEPIFDDFIKILITYKNTVNKELSVYCDKEFKLFQVEIADDKNLFDFFKECEKSPLGKEKVRYIKSFFANKINTEKLPIDTNQVIVEKEYSSTSSIYKICYEEKAILLSWITSDVFGKSSLKCQVDKEDVEILNISKVDHLSEHWEITDYLIYELNGKHKPQKTVGGFVSAMDLKDDEAQKVLNTTVVSKEGLKRRYGLYKGTFYEFRQHEKNKFHGFCNDGIPKDKKKELLK